jgi:hypothetical protein
MVEKSRLIYSRIDEKRFPEVIPKVKAILKETGSHKSLIFDDTFWKWQYRVLPPYEVRVYVVLSNDEIMGYYHVSVYDGFIRGEKKRIGMMSDGAICKEARRAGVCKGLIEYATADLAQAGIPVSYGFPNTRSAHAFQRYGRYAMIYTFGTYVLPVKTGAIIRSKINLLGIDKVAGIFIDFFFSSFSVKMPQNAAIQFHQKIDDDVVRVFSQYQKKHVICLPRDKKYLQRRFERRPYSTHFYFSIRKHQKVQAAAIFKHDKIFGNPVLLLMDFAYLPGEEQSLLALVQSVKKQGDKLTGRPFNLIVTSGCSDFLPNLKKIGFMRIPEKLDRRPLKLIAKSTPDLSADILCPQNWHLTLADYDVL